MTHIKLLAAAAVAVASFSGTAVAQVNANNLINVNVSNVANDIAKNLSIDVSDIPVTVQVPIGVAATVCGVQANVLASDNKGGEAACDATSTSQALNQVVKKQIGG